MEDKSALNKINSEERVNETISRDEENPVKDTSLALRIAEDLILELPASHEGRKQWLALFGQSAEAKAIRRTKKERRM